MNKESAEYYSKLIRFAAVGQSALSAIHGRGNVVKVDHDNGVHHLHIAFEDNSNVETYVIGTEVMVYKDVLKDDAVREETDPDWLTMDSEI